MLDIPKQVIALPRGVESDGSPTLATREVALTAVHYYEYHGADILLLPGGRSIMADDQGNGFSDSQAMREIVLEKGVPISVVPELMPSSDTISNALTCVPLIDLSEPLTVIAKEDHEPRGTWAVGFALGSKAVTGYVAMGKVDRDAIIQERRILFISKSMFIGISSGDIDAISHRNQRIQYVLSRRKDSIKNRLASLSHYQ